MSELLGTLLLIIVLGALPSVPNQLGPYVVGLLVWAIGLSLGGTTGYAINPARDLGLELLMRFYQLLVKVVLIGNMLGCL
jgi:glycerol uptake facilitator protein